MNRNQNRMSNILPHYHQKFLDLPKLRIRISFARTSFTFSCSPFTGTGSELVPSEGKVMQTLVGSMVDVGAAVEEGRSEMEPIPDRIRP